MPVDPFEASAAAASACELPAAGVTQQQYDYDVVVLFENDAWQQPLFDVLEARCVNYGRIDLKSSAFATASLDDLPRAKVYVHPHAHATTPTAHHCVAVPSLDVLRGRSPRITWFSRRSVG